MSDTKKLYLGEREITLVEDGLVAGTKRVSFVDGADDFPVWEVETLVSEEPIDETELRNRRGNYVVGKMLSLFSELDVHVEDVSFYIRKLLASMEENEQQLWLKMLGEESKEEVRLSDWQRAFDKK